MRGNFRSVLSWLLSSAWGKSIAFFLILALCFAFESYMVTVTSNVAVSASRSRNAGHLDEPKFTIYNPNIVRLTDIDVNCAYEKVLKREPDVAPTPDWRLTYTEHAHDAKSTHVDDLEPHRSVSSNSFCSFGTDIEDANAVLILRYHPEYGLPLRIPRTFFFVSEKDANGQLSFGHVKEY